VSCPAHMHLQRNASEKRWQEGGDIIMRACELKNKTMIYTVNNFSDYSSISFSQFLRNHL